MAQPSRAPHSAPLAVMPTTSNRASVRDFSLWRHATRATPWDGACERKASPRLAASPPRSGTGAAWARPRPCCPSTMPRACRPPLRTPDAINPPRSDPRAAATSRRRLRTPARHRITPLRPFFRAGPPADVISPSLATQKKPRPDAARALGHRRCAPVLPAPRPAPRPLSARLRLPSACPPPPPPESARPPTTPPPPLFAPACPVPASSLSPGRGSAILYPCQPRNRG